MNLGGPAQPIQMARGQANLGMLASLRAAVGTQLVCRRQMLQGAALKAAGCPREMVESVSQLGGSSGLECLVFASLPHHRHDVWWGGGEREGGGSH